MDQEPNQEVQDHEHVLTKLEILKRASRDLQNYSIFTSYDSHDASSIRPLLDLEIKQYSVFTSKPRLLRVNQLLCDLKTLVEKLEKFQGFGLRLLLHRQITRYKISQLGHAIEREIQAYMDRENVQKLVKVLEESSGDDEEEEKIEVLIEFVKRLSRGFDGDFQDLILKAKLFSVLERLLCDTTCSKSVREHASLAIGALASFNKNVFVGLVLMGPTIEALICMNSSCSIQVLCSLINQIRSPLIDEIHSRGEIPKIASLLRFNDLSIQVAAMDCICQIAYFGRREVVEAMIREGSIINNLMELQRSKIKKDNQIQCSDCDCDCDCDCVVIREENVESETNADDDCPLSNWVSRFAVQVEIGEGLSLKEKTEIKLEILKRVKDASVSETETASIVAEVLWGSSP